MRTKLAVLALGAALTVGAGQAGAVDVVRSATVGASADKVWAAVKDFCSIKDWHPAVAGCDLAEMGGLPKRTLHLEGGGEIVEVENFHSDQSMTIIYSILESPLPVIEYASTITVTPSMAGRSEVTWRGRFAAPDGQDEKAAGIIAGIYEAGLSTIANQLGQ